jgi:hypothetical protein
MVGFNAIVCFTTALCYSSQGNGFYCVDSNCLSVYSDLSAQGTRCVSPSGVSLLTLGPGSSCPPGALFFISKTGHLYLQVWLLVDLFQGGCRSGDRPYLKVMVIGTSFRMFWRPRILNLLLWADSLQEFGGFVKGLTASDH